MEDTRLIECLEKFISAHRAIEGQKDILRDSIGFDIDGPLNKALNKAEDAYICLFEAITGDKDESLSWFLYENGGGSKKMEAGFEDHMRPIESAEDLIWLMKLSID